ncbi:hypothetical protein [Amycolatopsis sp. NPDC051716]|uniref:TRADD-N-associated membrane domain-containing protein n=1 Tax=Amycolatopsis sp. NPDC051716 TaxID=3155804 RepID=UPI00344802BA
MTSYFVARTRSRDSDLQSQVGIELREQAASKVSEAKENAQLWTSKRLSAADERDRPVSDDLGESPGTPGAERVRLKSVAAEIVANAVDSASRDVNRYTRYADEALSRSKIAFWFSLVLGAMGFATILTGAVMAYFASLDASIVSGVAGVVNTSIAALLYQRSDVADQRASTWFEKAGDNLKESDNLQRALEVLDLLDDAETRNRLIAIAGIKQLFPGENAEALSDVMELKR